MTTLAYVPDSFQFNLKGTTCSALPSANNILCTRTSTSRTLVQKENYEPDSCLFRYHFSSQYKHALFNKVIANRTYIETFYDSENYDLLSGNVWLRLRTELIYEDKKIVDRKYQWSLKYCVSIQDEGNVTRKLNDEDAILVLLRRLLVLHQMKVEDEYEDLDDFVECHFRVMTSFACKRDVFVDDLDCKAYHDTVLIGDGDRYSIRTVVTPKMIGFENTAGFVPVQSKVMFYLMRNKPNIYSTARNLLGHSSYVGE